MTFMQTICDPLIVSIFGLLTFVIFAEVIFSWLIAFNIVNLRNPIIAQIYDIISRIARPILDPIRKVLPSIGGLELSPIVALFAFMWLQSLFRMGGPIFNAVG